jgi:F-type H+-transporting ATPase subunit epsilon
MPEHLIHLEIVTPGKVVFSDDVKSFTAPGSEGSFQILPRHAPFVTTLVPGPVKFVSKENETRLFAASGGTVEVHDNMINMLAEAIEATDEIDVARAEAARQRATKLLESNEQGVDKERAKSSLLRALNRIKLAGKK